MAVQLDARYEYFSVATALQTALTGLTTLTVCAWAKVTSDLNKDHDLVTWGPHASPTSGFLWWRDDVLSSGRTNSMAALLSTLRADGATGAWNDTNWRHVAFTWIANTVGGIKLYFNGVQDVNTGSSAGHMSITGYPSTPIRFGDTSPASAANWLLGSLDDIRIYNRVLSSAEIQTIVTCRGTDTVRNGLLLRYPLLDKAPGVDMDGTASEVKDIGSYTYHARGDSGTNYATFRASDVLNGYHRRRAA